MGVAFLIGGWGIFNLGVWLVPVFYFGKLAAYEVATVEPLYNGQIGDWPFVPCREVVPFSEVIIVSLLYHKIRGKYCARKSYAIL